MTDNNTTIYHRNSMKFIQSAKIHQYGESRSKCYIITLDMQPVICEYKFEIDHMHAYRYIFDQSSHHLDYDRIKDNGDGGEQGQDHDDLHPGSSIGASSTWLPPTRHHCGQGIHKQRHCNIMLCNEKNGMIR